MTWPALAFLRPSVVAAITAAVRVRRYSATHVVGEVAFAGRGVFFSRTADGTWWEDAAAHPELPWPPRLGHRSMILRTPAFVNHGPPGTRVAGGVGRARAA